MILRLLTKYALLVCHVLEWWAFVVVDNKIVAYYYIFIIGNNNDIPLPFIIPWFIDKLNNKHYSELAYVMG